MDDLVIPEVIPGDVWEDEHGRARVLAVAEDYAMMRRRRSNPFIVSVAYMQDGVHGWQKVTP